jgi:hypothetical protein
MHADNTVKEQKPQQKNPSQTNAKSPCYQPGLDVSQNADCDDDVAERRWSVSMPEAYWCV